MGKYRRKIGGRQYANNTNESLTKAVKERLKGKSLRCLQEKYGIPKSTIHNKSRGKQESSYGEQCVLSAEEETKLAENII